MPWPTSWSEHEPSVQPSGRRFHLGALAKGASPVQCLRSQPPLHVMLPCVVAGSRPRLTQYAVAACSVDVLIDSTNRPADGSLQTPGKAARSAAGHSPGKTPRSVSFANRKQAGSPWPFLHEL